MPSDPLPKPPKAFKTFVAKHPKLGQAHELMAEGALEGALEAGPLDAKTCELIKIGICVGSGLESGLRAHVRKACALGASREEVEQAIVQAMSTCGLPRTVTALSWAQIQFDRDVAETE